MERAVLKKKAEGHVKGAGYKLLEDKSGFDICGVKVKGPAVGDEYLAVGCNVYDEVTIRYVNPFIEKFNAFKAFKLPPGSLSSVKGLIAYSGNGPTPAIRRKAEAAGIEIKKL